jgi:hypothetical protein
MSKTSFLHLFAESVVDANQYLPLGTETFTEAKEELDKDINCSSVGTETFTHARTEERDQDHHLSDLHIIPRPM